jgi:hypothetical protein
MQWTEITKRERTPFIFLRRGWFEGGGSDVWIWKDGKPHGYLPIYLALYLYTHGIITQYWYLISGISSLGYGYGYGFKASTLFQKAARTRTGCIDMPRNDQPLPQAD